MSISDKDIKKLWGLAAGICSRPGCNEDCLKFLDSNDPTVIGEMAHVIAKKPDGPRGVEEGGEDTYKNLILLCPTDHTEIDKAPEGTYPSEVIFEWKERHEKQVKDSLVSPLYDDSKTLAEAIKRLLIQNKSTWQRYGPESLEAQNNPLSNLYEIWPFRKLDIIVPNNRKIIQLINKNQKLIDVNDLDICTNFIEHAEGFEMNCYSRREGVLRFPLEFEELVNRYAGI